MYSTCILLKYSGFIHCYTCVIHVSLYNACITIVYDTFVIHPLYKSNVYWMYNKCILLKYLGFIYCYTFVIHVSLYNECMTSV